MALQRTLFLLPHSVVPENEVVGLTGSGVPQLGAGRPEGGGQQAENTPGLFSELSWTEMEEERI